MLRRMFEPRPFREETAGRKLARVGAGLLAGVGTYATGYLAIEATQDLQLIRAAQGEQIVHASHADPNGRTAEEDFRLRGVAIFYFGGQSAVLGAVAAGVVERKHPINDQPAHPL